MNIIHWREIQTIGAAIRNVQISARDVQIDGRGRSQSLEAKPLYNTNNHSGMLLLPDEKQEFKIITIINGISYQ